MAHGIVGSQGSIFPPHLLESIFVAGLVMKDPVWFSIGMPFFGLAVVFSL